MEVIYEKTNEENNQPKVNVYEQQNDMKDLKEECNKDDKDKVHKISSPLLIPGTSGQGWSAIVQNLGALAGLLYKGISNVHSVCEFKKYILCPSLVANIALKLMLLNLCILVIMTLQLMQWTRESFSCHPNLHLRSFL